MVDLSRLGARSYGVWTRRQARALLRGGQVDALVRSGQWQVLWSGVYADAGIAPSPEQRAAAAVLAVGGDPGQPHETRALASGRTAARVWGFPLIDDDDPATGAQQRRLDDVAVDRRLPRQQWAERTLLPRPTLPVGRGERVQLDSGLMLTSPLRTLVDCARLLTQEALVCVLDDALHRHLVAPAQLAAAAASRAGLPGARALRSAVALADGRAESPAETLARLLLRPVLPGLEPQVELFDGSARPVARFDLADRAVRLAVEADGVRGHAGRAMVAKDRRRDRTTGAYGWETERVTWFELRREPRLVVRRLVDRHAQLVARTARQTPSS